MLQKGLVKASGAEGVGSSSNSSSCSTGGGGNSTVGVSLSYLQALAASLTNIPEADPTQMAGMTTGHLMHLMILPTLSKTFGKCRLLDLVPKKYTAHPHYYISHAWGGSFMGFVDSLSNEVAPEPGPTEPPMPSGFKDSIYIWSDLFAFNHFTANSATPQEAQAQAAEALMGCSKGLILVVDKEGVCLGRMRCLYEVFLATYRLGETAVRLALPAAADSRIGIHLQIPEMIKIHKACLSVDISRAETDQPHIRMHILGEVRHSAGLQRTNVFIAQALAHALHSKLRWRGRAGGLAALAALLLHSRELFQLQLLLCAIPELRDDEKGLTEMRQIFNTFDTLHCGELDEEQFVMALQSAGFEADDALKVFYDVNTDGEGGVSLDEFEAWWKGLSEEASGGGATQLTNVDLTVPALVSNLEAMAAFMSRIKLSEYAEFFLNASVQEGAYGGEAGPGGGGVKRLTIPVLRGDSVKVVDLVSEKLDGGDFRGAAKLLYELLIQNTELLDVDPATLTKDEGIKGIKDLSLAVAAHMEVLSRVLRYQGPSRVSQYRYLVKTAQELRAPPSATTPTGRRSSLVLIPGGGLGGGGPLSGNKARRSSVTDSSLLGSASTFLSNRKSLRETLKVKYGQDYLVSKLQVTEAQIGISQFTAMIRSNAPAGHIRKEGHHSHAPNAASPSGTSYSGGGGGGGGTGMPPRSSYRPPPATEGIPSLADLRTKITKEMEPEAWRGSGTPTPGAGARSRRSSLMLPGLPSGSASRLPAIGGGGGAASGGSSGRSFSPYPDPTFAIGPLLTVGGGDCSGGGIDEDDFDATMDPRSRHVFSSHAMIGFLKDGETSDTLQSLSQQLAKLNGGLTPSRLATPASDTSSSNAGSRMPSNAQLKDPTPPNSAQGRFQGHSIPPTLSAVHSAGLPRPAGAAHRK